MGRGRRLGRGVWVFYLGTGAVLSILRVALDLWLSYRIHTGTQTAFDHSLLWVLYFEDLMTAYIPLGSVSETAYHFVWTPILILNSFIMATPILLVGWLMRRSTTSRPRR